VCYILTNRPSACHHRDNLKLLDTLAALEHKGNTVVVGRARRGHDPARAARHRPRPGRGKLGGRIVAEGTLEALMRHPDSVTGRCLAQPLKHPLMPRRPWRSSKPRDAAIEIVGASDAQPAAAWMCRFRSGGWYA